MREFLNYCLDRELDCIIVDIQGLDNPQASEYWHDFNDLPGYCCQTEAGSTSVGTRLKGDFWTMAEIQEIFTKLGERFPGKVGTVSAHDADGNEPFTVNLP